jgi:translation initiation factor IF-3
MALREALLLVGLLICIFAYFQNIRCISVVIVIFYIDITVTTLSTEKIRINREIRAPELRVIGAQGENLGVIALNVALEAAKAAGLDLIEISPNAVPPVAKITDYGKFEYERGKKERAARAKAKVSETKEVQIKVGTGENDMRLKAKKAAQWLAEGHRVRAELFLKGRYKGMDEAFLKVRLEKFIMLIPYAYRLADPIARAPKGFAAILERDPKATDPTKQTKRPEETSDTESTTP